MDTTGIQIKFKTEPNLDVETADEANNLLKNGIFVETSKG